MADNVKPHRSWLCDEDYCGGNVDNPCDVAATTRPVAQREFLAHENDMQRWKRKQRINVANPTDEAAIKNMLQTARDSSSRAVLISERNQLFPVWFVLFLIALLFVESLTLIVLLAH